MSSTQEDLDSNPFINNDDDDDDHGLGRAERRRSDDLAASTSAFAEADVYPQDVAEHQDASADQDEGPMPTSAAYEQDNRARSGSTTSSIRPPRDTIQVSQYRGGVEHPSSSHSVPPSLLECLHCSLIRASRPVCRHSHHAALGFTCKPSQLHCHFDRATLTAFASRACRSARAQQPPRTPTH